MPEAKNPLTGYSHPDYARALAEVGTPLPLAKSGGWLLKRQIPDSGLWDAMGCYPLFACENWHGLKDDLDNLGDDIVSLSLVTDPFGDYDEACLQRSFGSVVRAFKEHFVTDLDQPVEQILSKHHLRNAKKAETRVSVEACADPGAHAEDWCGLYANLIDKHGIRGIADFSPASLRRQLAVPGTVLLRASSGGETVGMLLWYVSGPVAYYHLGAYTDRGYGLRASFALFLFSIEYFAKTLRWLALGAGAGAAGDGEDGLSRFKSGWATGTRTAYFCGRIFDAARYTDLVSRRGSPATEYFPAYRAGEFA